MNYEKRDKTFDEKVLEISRVSRTVKGGKRISFRALIVVGDRRGKVGIGSGKGTEVAIAIKKASNRARKDLKIIKISEKDSIFREVISQYGTSRVLLRPAPQGTSIIAGGVVRAVAELSGVKNLVAKLYGSNNKKNTAFATIQGLLKAGETGRV